MFNLYLAYTDCLDIIKHIEIDKAKALGFDSNLIHKCEDNLMNIDNNLIIVPRSIFTVSENEIHTCLNNSKYVLIGCIPNDTSTARKLAKVSNTITIIITPKNLRFVNEYQVNVMTQTCTSRYLEIHVYPFIAHLLEENVLKTDVEKEFYLLGNVIEKALKNDVAVIPSASSPSIRKTLLTNHLDLILNFMGFSKRERRLMLELYPKDLIHKWLKIELM